VILQLEMLEGQKRLLGTNRSILCPDFNVFKGEIFFVTFAITPCISFILKKVLSESAIFC